MHLSFVTKIEPMMYDNGKVSPANIVHQHFSNVTKYDQQLCRLEQLLLFLATITAADYGTFVLGLVDKLGDHWDPPLGPPNYENIHFIGNMFSNTVLFPYSMHWYGFFPSSIIPSRWNVGLQLDFLSSFSSFFFSFFFTPLICHMLFVCTSHFVDHRSVLKKGFILSKTNWLYKFLFKIIICIQTALKTTPKNLKIWKHL